MRISSTLVILLFSIPSQAQIPDQEGQFPEIQAAKVKSISHLHISFNDTTDADTTFFQKVYFNTIGQLIQREFPGYAGFRKRTITYSYNRRGYLVRADSSGLFGSGRGGIGEDTLYSHKEEIWEHFQFTQRIFQRRSTIDNWKSYTETRFLYDVYGRLTEERSVFVEKDFTEIGRFGIRYVYEFGTILREKVYYSEENIVSKERYLFEYY